MTDVIGIIGTGTMGRGIAQIAALAGYNVLLADAHEGAAQEARNALAATFAKLAERGKLEPSNAEAATKRLAVVAPDGAELAACSLIVEAIIEEIGAKKALFARLEAIISPKCILASNTSSLSITRIAAGCKHPDRVVGLHFFNPVPLMKVVEVVEGLNSSPQSMSRLMEFAKHLGHTPVKAKDTPGFIVNHAGRGYGPEALRLLEEGVTNAPTIDRILVEQGGFRMGPFELYDLVGLDVSAAVMETLYQQFYHEPRYRPSPLVRSRVEAGLLGKKSSHGFYDYANGQILRPSDPQIPGAPSKPVWIASDDADLRTLVTALGSDIDTGKKPSADSLILTTPLGDDASGTAVRLSLDPRRIIAIDPLFGFDRRRVLMATPATLPEFLNAAHALFASDGMPVSLIRDSYGFVTQRVVANIINIACEIAQMGIATPSDIDTAVRLGLGYPMGPLAWGDALGAARILGILDNLHANTKDPRWRASAWLRRRAELGLSLLFAEA
jgi:3-hydroxybutyryl-CoA dehydrogenase